MAKANHLTVSHPTGSSIESAGPAQQGFEVTQATWHTLCTYEFCQTQCKTAPAIHRTAAAQDDNAHCLFLHCSAAAPAELAAEACCLDCMLRVRAAHLHTCQHCSGVAGSQRASATSRCVVATTALLWCLHPVRSVGAAAYYQCGRHGLLQCFLRSPAFVAAAVPLLLWLNDAWRHEHHAQTSV